MTKDMFAPDDSAYRSFWLCRPSWIEWIYLGVGLTLVTVYRWLMDDAFIYFRYVDNLLFLDSGLTYNRGEYVEGFTSPLYCLLLTGLRWLEIDYSTIVLVIGYGAFGAFWYLLVLVNRSLSPQKGGRALNLPLAYLSANYAVTSYFTSGLESPLAQLWGAIYAALFVRPSSTVLAIAVALSHLVRPELALAVAVAVPYCWWRNRRIPHALIAAAAIGNGGWFLFRVGYYADLFPNTFYLKNTTNLGEGLAFLRNHNDSYHLLSLLTVFLGVAGYLTWRSRRGTRDTFPSRLVPRAAMLTLALLLTGFVVKIGGGAIHGYYLWAPFVLGVACTAGLLEELLCTLRIRRRRVMEATLMVSFAAIVATWHSTTLSVHPLRITTKVQYQEAAEPSGRIADPTIFRVGGLNVDYWRQKSTVSALRGPAPTLVRSGYRATESTGSCAQAYLDFGVRWVHSFGLTDAFLSRVETPEKRKGHRPGLKPLAADLARIQAEATSIGRGMFEEAVSAGTAPEWVVANLSVLKAIERRVYNRHYWDENVRLVLSDPGRIDPGNTYEEWRARKRTEREKGSPARPKRRNPK